MLAVPLKKPSEVEVAKPLRTLLQNAYNRPSTTADSDGAVAKPIDYNNIAKEFGALRNTAIWKFQDKYESSLEVVYGYYDQLCSLETKIPAYELQIPFKWKNAFDKGSIFGGRLALTLTSLPYEKVCVLFNIAALQSAVAASQSYGTDDGLKVATKLFQQSAGIYAHLRTVAPAIIASEPTPDLNPDTLHALGALMLAQAQECCVTKAIRDSMKSAIVARLASQCEALYGEALHLMQREPMRNDWDKDWLPIVGGKQFGQQAIAELYQSQVCRDRKAFGEEIARLQHAVELFGVARSRSGREQLYEEHCQRATVALTEARKDNDMIYNEMIPDVKTLIAPAKVALAKALPLEARLGRKEDARDLFVELVPVALHQALQACESRRAEVVNAEIMKLREATQMLNGVLASLNLPAALEVTSTGAMPASLLEKAATVRGRGGIESVRSLVKELPDLLVRNREILDETERMLTEEQQCDDTLRAQFKERWNRTSSAKLTDVFRSNLGKYREVIGSAVNADKVVREKFEKNAKGIELLSKEAADLEAAVPSCGGGGGGGAQQPSAVDAGCARDLWQLMDRVTTLKAERDVIESDLKSATVDMREQFLVALAQDGAINEAALSVPGIGKALDPLRQAAGRNLAAQAEIVQAVQTAHKAFTAGSGSSQDARETFFSELATAHNYFVELQDNLKEGIKFYNNLTELLLALQTKIGDFCFARKTEKDQLMRELTHEMSRVAEPANPAVPAHFPAPDPKTTNYNPPATPSPATPATSAPYPSQMQSMPMPYGATAAAPYPTYVPPPMPAGYNPYATLPYPNNAFAYQNFPAGPPMQHYGTYPGAYGQQQQQQQHQPPMPGYPHPQ